MDAPPLALGLATATAPCLNSAWLPPEIALPTDLLLAPQCSAGF